MAWQNCGPQPARSFASGPSRIELICIETGHHRVPDNRGIFPSQLGDNVMMFKKVAIAAATVAAGIGALVAAPAAQAQDQFVPLLVYRTGQFAPLGIPWADGKQDYIKLVNAKGGINGVKIAYEECETADRKSTRLNSSHTVISYAVFCLKKKKKKEI